MKHLHLHFIIASLALGLGFFNLLMAFWEAHLLTLAPQLLLRLGLMAGLFLAAGATLVFYGWHEVRAEIMHLRRKS